MLQLSMRRIHDLVAFCLAYELEDVVAEVTEADRIEPSNQAELERSRRAYKALRFVAGSARFARALTPLPHTDRLERSYDLFFPVFNHVHELFTLASVPDWRARCRKAACFVSELWVHQLPQYLLELLAQFDHVFLGVRGPVDQVAAVTGRPCSYLPLAVDVLRFAPFPRPPGRTIDVCSVGRRSAVTHRALLALARERKIFDDYDTVAASGASGKQRTFHVDDPAAHRLLLASLLQRSRYFIANRARINEPEFTQGRDEISSRFCEGIAAGAVMLGEPPRTDEFTRSFDWPDVVIPLPFDAPGIGEALAELDADPSRLERIRRENVRNAALRHDWVYRIRSVFDTLGIPPTEAMLAREERLKAVAAQATGVVLQGVARR